MTAIIDDRQSANFDVVKHRPAFFRAFMRAFMAFWYRYVGQLNVWLPSITVGGKRLVISPAVYKPLENEHACTAYTQPGDRALDIGCGSGVNAVFVGPHVREVVATDISPAAVANTEENCRLHGVTNVTVLQSDMFDAIEGKFDLILANPPYITETFENEDAQFATSERFLPTLFREAPQHLSENGRLLVQYPLWYRRRIERLAELSGLEVVSVKRTPLKGPGLFLLSMLYMQVGWRSAFYLCRVRQDDQAKITTTAKSTGALRTLTPKQEMALTCAFPVALFLFLILSR